MEPDNLLQVGMKVKLKHFEEFGEIKIKKTNKQFTVTIGQFDVRFTKEDFMDLLIKD